VLRAFNLNEETANNIIMAARAHWFPDQPAADAADTTPAPEGQPGA